MPLSMILRRSMQNLCWWGRICFSTNWLKWHCYHSDILTALLPKQKVNKITKLYDELCLFVGSWGRGRISFRNARQVLLLKLLADSVSIFFSLMYFCLVSARFVRGECGGKFFCCCLKRKKKTSTESLVCLLTLIICSTEDPQGSVKHIWADGLLRVNLHLWLNIQLCFFYFVPDGFIDCKVGVFLYSVLALQNPF